LGNTNISTTTSCAGFFFVVSPVQQENSSKDIDCFIEELLTKDKSLEHDLSEGRKWAAEVLYAEHPESLKTLRLKMGYSQVQLAEKIGMKQPNICEFEAGKRKPNIDTLVRLADALGTTADVVLKSISPLE
jgi:DNA-binding XRE family transcriptional regulator